MRIQESHFDRPRSTRTRTVWSPGLTTDRRYFNRLEARGDDDELMGYVTWHHAPYGNPEEASVGNLEVFPDFRRQGVATQLFDDLHERYPRVRVGTVLPDGRKFLEGYKRKKYEEGWA